MIKTNLNSECGRRLKECLIDAKMTQKELAENTHYTQQYISNIISGKKNLSIPAAKRFAQFLHVSEEYLLCQSKYRTLSEERRELFKIQHKEWAELSNAVQTLVDHTGYKIIGRYAADWDRLKNDIGGFQFASYSDALQAIDDCLIEADDLYDFVDIVYEIETPNKEIIYIKRSLYDSTLNSIENYAKFAMDNMKTHFMYDDFWAHKTPGSEIPYPSNTN